MLKRGLLVLVLASLFTGALFVVGQEPPERKSSYSPVVITEPFAKVMARMKGEKAAVMARQRALLAERYDLANRPAEGAKMTGASRYRKACAPSSRRASVGTASPR